jgi:hypothetical protein
MPRNVGALFLYTPPLPLHLPQIRQNHRQEPAMISNTTPVFAVDEKNLVPVSDHLKQMMDIPPSRMFLINKSLKVYKEKNPDRRSTTHHRGRRRVAARDAQSRFWNARFNSKSSMAPPTICPSAPTHTANRSSSSTGNWILLWLGTCQRARHRRRT